MNDLNTTSNAVNVLIIDDETQIRKFLDIALRAQGYKTLLAETGQQGLETLELHRKQQVAVGISYSPPVGFSDDSGSPFSCRKRRFYNGLLRRCATKKL